MPCIALISKKVDKVTNNNKITFQADGSPYSQAFDDIYFDTESGFQQSEQVFIQGNQIEQQLLSNTDELVIGETGFGTGLNFLLTLKLYQKLAKQHHLPKLHFISTEKYPLTHAQLAQSLACFEQLTEEVKLLLSCYPEQVSTTIDQSILSEKVRLTIYLGDATESLAAIALAKKSNGLVNAWYLDGFSPAKNPEMWTPMLFQQMARLSKPQATISTFTVAGFIRRGLQQVGFRLEKQSYQGKKKEILAGKYQQNSASGKGYQLRPDISKPQHVSIIGGGIASACAAYALTKKGIKVTLYCRDQEVAQGASSNAIGALYPLLHQQQDEISLFYQQAFWHARTWYQQLIEDGYHFAHNWCGLLEVSYKKALTQRQQIFAKNKPWPEQLIHSISAKQASELANIQLDFGGLFMPYAGWIAPGELVNQLLKAAQDTNKLKIKTKVNIEKISQLENGKWQLHSNKGEFGASVLVYCGGAEAIDIPYINQLPLTSVRGQVTSVNSNPKMARLNTVICHKGYLTPAHDDIHCIGATFEKNSQNTISSEADDQYNLAMLHRCLPDLTTWQTKDIHASKARLRCMTPDHLPLVGAMPDIEQHKQIYAHLAKDKNWRSINRHLWLITSICLPV